MGDVHPLPKKKKVKRVLVSVCWGGFGKKDYTDHIAIKGADIDVESGVLIVNEGKDELVAYPIGSIYYWKERPFPEDDDVG